MNNLSSTIASRQLDQVELSSDFLSPASLKYVINDLDNRLCSIVYGQSSAAEYLKRIILLFGGMIKEPGANRHVNDISSHVVMKNVANYRLAANIIPVQPLRYAINDLDNKLCSITYRCDIENIEQYIKRIIELFGGYADGVQHVNGLSSSIHEQVLQEFLYGADTSDIITAVSAINDIDNRLKSVVFDNDDILSLEWYLKQIILLFGGRVMSMPKSVPSSI